MIPMIKPRQVEFHVKGTQEWIHEIKYDGERNLLIWDGTKARIQRHEGRVKSDHFPEIIDYFDDKSENYFSSDTFTLDGEVCVLKNNQKADFPSILSRQTTDHAKQRLLLKSKPVHFIAFDIVELNGEDLTKKPFKERREILETLGFVGTDADKMMRDEHRILIVEEEVHLKGSTEHEKRSFVKENDLEGLVIKNPDKPYDWVKIKNFDEDEFTIFTTKLSKAGKENGWFISTLCLENEKGEHVGDVKYINEPQTQEAKDNIVGRKAIIRYMKSDGKLRFPVLQKIL